jgi:hypothetical protein
VTCQDVEQSENNGRLVQYFKLYYTLYNVPRVGKRYLSQRQFDTVAFAYTDFFAYIRRHIRAFFEMGNWGDVWERVYKAGDIELVIACPNWWRQKSAKAAMRAAAVSSKFVNAWGAEDTVRFVPEKEAVKSFVMRQTIHGIQV